MQLPIRLVSQVIADLLASELILEVCLANDKLRAFTPAKDVTLYSLKYVVETLDKNGNNNILKMQDDNLNKVLQIQENFLQAINSDPDNIPIQKLKEYNSTIKNPINH